MDGPIQLIFRPSGSASSSFQTPNVICSTEEICYDLMDPPDQHMVIRNLLIIYSPDFGELVAIKENTR